MDESKNEYKVVYNNRYGGFGLSKEGIEEYNNRTGRKVKYDFEIVRDDQVLIQLVEEMGDKINDKTSKLKIKSFPIKYKAFLDWDEYDGKESVSISYDKYLIHHVGSILDDDNMNNDNNKKIESIKELYKEYYDSPSYKRYKSIFQ
jgi:hypothetical protein